jgi:hypothetical protein
MVLNWRTLGPLLRSPKSLGTKQISMPENHFSLDGNKNQTESLELIFTGASVAENNMKV